MSGGQLIVNSSLIAIRCDREDIDVMYLKANDLANSIGANRSPNVVVLGAYAALSGVVNPDAIRKQVGRKFGRKPKVAEINLQAFQVGFDAGLAWLKDNDKSQPKHWS